MRRPLRGNRRGVGGLVIIVIVVIVAVGVVVGGLYAAGVFKPSSSGGSGPTYSVTFSETGLAAKTSWSVTLQGSTQSSTTSSISFTKSNGSYAFTVSATGYTASPSSGTVAVSGANLQKAVTFKIIPTYSVTFTETGLGPGISWGVTFNGATQSGTGSSIAFAAIANGTYSFSTKATGYTAAPASGSITVAGASVTEPIAFTAIPPTTYTVTFTETGLTAGTSWTVTFDGTPQSGPGSSIVFTGYANGTGSFSASATNYTASPASGTVTVSGADVTQPITFTAVTPGTYTVTFTETGLSAGASWTVTFDGTPQSGTGSTIVFAGIVNGTGYAFSVSATGYTAAPASGTVTVNGADVTQPITFTQLTYTVTFTETGLSGARSWTATLNGVPESGAGSSIVFTEIADGMYSFSASATGYTASPASGTVTVNGADVTQPITFSAIPPGSYTVTFTETGLSSGVSWSVTLNGATESSSTASITFTEQNGTYSYTVGSVSGYTRSPSSGSVTVAGAAQTVAITFTAVTPGTFAVSFSETGLSSGTSWSVTLNGTTMSSGTSTITFTEQNGTYTYDVGAVSGYTATPSSGTVHVAGGPTSVTISFASSGSTTEYPVTFSQTGLPGNYTWEVLLYFGSIFGLAPGVAGHPGAQPTSAVSAIFGEAAEGASFEFAAPSGTYFWEATSVTNTSYVATPSYGNLTVTSPSASVVIVFAVPPTYTLTFTETGLPDGAPWSVSLAESSGTAGSPIMVSEPNGTYFYEVSTEEPGYAATVPSGNVTVNGRAVSVAVTFTTAYTVTFTQTGIPLTDFTIEWQVTFAGMPSSSLPVLPIMFTASNGAYPWSASAPGYAASPASGMVTVNGADVSVAITFTAVATSTLTFTETGLASGASWYVVLNVSVGFGEAGQTITFNLTNGAYPYTASASGYLASPASGTVTIRGVAVSVHITFTRITTYSVTFTESGLPSGDSWDVEMGLNGAFFFGSSNSSTTTTLVVNVPNGNYTWVIDFFEAPGYVPSPIAGGMTILGAGTSQAITFTHAPADHLILFEELNYEALGSYGNPNGTTWSVTLGATTQRTTGMYIGFAEPNGTYTYTIQGPPGYVAVPNAGSFMVNSPSSVAFSSPAATVYLYFVTGSGGAVGILTSMGGGSATFFLCPVATRVFYRIA